MEDTKLRDVGEFELIKLLNDLISNSTNTSTDTPYKLIKGIGDDAAIWHSPENTQLLTTDTSVQGVHFQSRPPSWHDVGWKAMIANLSDIAAMGGIPMYAVITLGLDPKESVRNVMTLYRGIIQAASEYNCHIVGGDIVQSTQQFISIALLGYCTHKPLTRTGALAGESIAVTGTLGGSLAGLNLLTETHHKAFRALSITDRDELIKIHTKPAIARINEGSLLARANVSSAIDISDGLYSDLGKLCSSSKVSAIIHKSLLPIEPSLASLPNAQQFLLGLQSGEEYELLFTAPQQLIRQVIESLPIKYTIIGEITPAQDNLITILDENNTPIYPSIDEWDHLQT